MGFQKSYLIIYAGLITVSLVIGSKLNVGMRHPDYAGLLIIPYLLITLPLLFIIYGLIYGLPFISTFLIVKQRYLHAGIGSVILGLFWLSPIINNATSYAPLSWIGVTGVGLVSLCHLLTGVIALIFHFNRKQIPLLVSHVLCGVLLVSAFPIPIDMILYYTTTQFFYL
jgi:hypothetical protein